MVDAPAPTPDNEQQPSASAVHLETAINHESAISVESTEPPESETAGPEPAAAETTTAEAPAAVLEPVAAPPEAAPVAPAPEPSVIATAVRDDAPMVASTLDLPANPEAAASSEASSGGEWELLLEKLRSWWASGQLQQQWQASRTPLSLLAGLIALLLVLKVYSGLVNVLDSLPLLPGLLELVGLITVVQFSLNKLVRSDDRRQVISGLQQRWQSFKGRS